MVVIIPSWMIMISATMIVDDSDDASYVRRGDGSANPATVQRPQAATAAIDCVYLLRPQLRPKLPGSN